ncbi:MAG TPA: FAD-dependent oxidoreductase [bacterium]|nr:FAD-dependent oxidoreductase [bacterium]
MTVVHEPAQDVPVVAEADVVVVGGGPAGLAAAVAAGRAGARTLLLERYGYLGGMAAGGMVLLLDDMADRERRTVAGIGYEMVRRLVSVGGAVEPPEADCFKQDIELWWRWARWGFEDFYSRMQPHPTTYAAAFDPEAWKQVAFAMAREAGVALRMHSWFSRAIVEDGRVRAAIVQTKAGRQAILGRMFIDASGDGDLYAAAGAPFVHGRYMLSLVHRLAAVDVERVVQFERGHPEEARALNAEVKRIIGGSWDLWWLRTPREGVIWCNCPHVYGLDGLSVEDLTRLEVEGRERFVRALTWLRGHMPGFERAYILDASPQAGVRQTRVLEGEYVMTKDDVLHGRRFPDVIGRGRDYFMPYRALLPKGVEGMLVAGRCYSATPEAQRLAREIAPCMVMGEAAGTAAAMALEAGVEPRAVDVPALQRRLVALGADLGLGGEAAASAAGGGTR